MATEEIVEEQKERGGTVLSVRFSAEELEQIKEAAQRADMPVSVYVRRYALLQPSASSVSTGSTNLAPPTVVQFPSEGYEGGEFRVTTGHNG